MNPILLDLWLIQPTNNLPSGAYIVSLKWNGSTKDLVKLIISK